ncbi:lysozyme inhibitor LprI family protein [Acinetobacter piscicola]|uniref:lysozyme inhibitor LprI family protein n=1 Tax=Acinetobacter piscicola TaxID=2006115 RepID=UPI000B7D9A43|nr:lysozyme inhibitor LprI family protein [Acinetobacter piscicola]
MMKACMTTIILATLICSTFAYADPQNSSPDAYSQCVDQTIQKLDLGNINNAVVEFCSQKTKATYEKQIVALLDQIKQHSEKYQQPERYKDIMKSQQLWKNYVDQECKNAGTYIGSPMYAFCPMKEYGTRVEQLTEYAQ